jgi:hypothetical protein
MTFHIGEQNKLEDIDKNIKLKNVRPTKDHPLELWRIETQTKNSMGINLGTYSNFFFLVPWDHCDKSTR